MPKAHDEDIDRALDRLSAGYQVRASEATILRRVSLPIAVLSLQRAAGNKAVSRLLAEKTLPKDGVKANDDSPHQRIQRIQAKQGSAPADAGSNQGLIDAGVSSDGGTHGGMSASQTPDGGMVSAVSAPKKDPETFDLDVTDLTGSFKSLSSGARGKSTDKIILHRTGGSTGASAQNKYKDRMRQHQHVGAQYLIDEKGDISLIVPADNRVEHIRDDARSSSTRETADRDIEARRKTKGDITSGTTIGIEIVGVELAVNPIKAPVKGKLDVKEVAKLRGDLAALPLSPTLRSRLSKLSDKQLFYQLKWSDWTLYGDVTPAQKEAVVVLVHRLANKYHLSESSDVLAHEQVDKKTMDEGGAAQTAVRDVAAFRDKYTALQAALSSNPKAGSVSVGTVNAQKELDDSKVVLDALAVAHTLAENASLAKKDPGALGRKKALDDFFADPAGRLKAVESALAAARAASPADAGVP